MARRNSNTESTVTESTVETVEAPEVEAVEAVEAEVTETAPEPEVDLTEFKAAAEKAAGEADESTGDLPKESIAAVNEVYRAIEGMKGKTQARLWLDEMMKDAISERKDIGRARAFVDIKDGLNAGSRASGGTRAPSDPTEAFVQKVATLNLAYNEAVASVTDEVSRGWSDKVAAVLSELEGDIETYRTYLSGDKEGDAPEVSPVVRQAFKLSHGKLSGAGGSTRPAGAPRRNTETHINQVFADLPVGSFLSLTEISKAASEEYGSDRPSTGAITARLFPQGREMYASETVVATAVEGQGRGATKIA